MSRGLQLLVLTFLFLAPLPGFSTGFGDPRGFLANETVTETPLYPGVVWYQVTGSHLGFSQVAHIVTVDIAEPHLTMKALPGERFVNEATGQFFRRSTVSQLQADNDVLVAINTAFFDIAATMTPTGLLMQDKMLLREPQGGGNTFAFTETGFPAIASFGSSRTLRYGAASRNYAGFNRNVLGDNGAAVYQQPWDRSPGASADFIAGRQITEVLLERTGFIPSPNPSTPARMQGKVLQVRNNLGSVPIPANRFVITAAGNARAFLQQMTIDSTVEVEWSLTGGVPGINWNTFAHGAAGGSLLVVNGTVQSQSNAHWDNRHPRSAIGIGADSSQLLLLLVEGRQAGRAEGMSLHSVGQFFRHMNANNALEFDGGGSSSIAARVNGTNMRLNTPSGGSERLVPAGLGVHVLQEPDHALFTNIRVSSSEGEAAISWETMVPTISQAKFGQARLDRQSAREPVFRTRHTAVLSGLDAPGFYYARLMAELSNGSKHVSQIVPIPRKSDGEIIIDDPEAVLTGAPDWSTGVSPTPWGPSYRWSSTVTGSPTHTATFSPAIRLSGIYDVYTWYVHGTNRPADARYQIQHAGGIRNVSVNQTANGSQWRLLASNLRFNIGGDYHVRIVNQSNEAAKALMADAARWLLTAPDPVDAEAVPPWWMIHFFGENPPGTTVDADGDGATIRDEYLWGTDPTDPDSRPRYRLGREENGFWTFAFSPFHEGRTYRVQGRASLTEGDWQDVAAPSPVRLETGEGLLVLPNPQNLERAFYRLKVSL